MKRVLVSLAVCCSLVASAQQLGVSAQGLISFQFQREIPYNNRIIKSGTAPAAGIRLEANYILPGYGFPVAAYNGLGVTYIAPVDDSAVFSAQLRNNGSRFDIASTQKTSVLSIGYRCGYEIPQDFNEFMLIHFGWGAAWTKYTTRNILPSQSPAFMYTESDFEPEDLGPIKSNGASIELLTGVVYEFEMFSVIGQYSALIPLSHSQGYPRIRHGLNVGLFYTLFDLR